MWQPPFYWPPGSSHTYYPSYEAYHGFVGGNEHSSNRTAENSNQNNQINKDDAKSCLALPAPNPPDPSSVQAPHPTAPMAPTSNAQPLPVNMYLLPPQSNHNVNESNSNNNSQQTDPFKPANQFVPMPILHGMFPVPPPPMPTQSQNIFPPMPFPPQHSPFTVPSHHIPAGTVPVPGQTHGVPSQNPTISAAPPAQADMRYKCEICGRYRSAHYHYNHPIPPGQLPHKTICRKCRKEATDSEETSSSESHREPRPRRHQTRGPAWKYRRQSRSRARSRDLTRLIDEGYSRYSTTSFSESDSSSTDRRASRSTRHKYRRPGTPGTELVRHTRGLRLSPLGERTYYNPESSGHTRHHVDRSRQEREMAHRSQSRFRAASTEPRIIRRQYSDPFMSSSQVENPPASYASPAYFDGPSPAYQRQSYSPQRGPRPPWERIASIPGYPGPPPIPQDLYNSDDEHDGKFRRRVRSKSRSRSRSRSTRRHRSSQRHPSRRYHEVESEEEFDHRVEQAPSPPPLRSSSLGYLGEGVDEHYETRSSRGRHRRPRSRSRGSPELLKPGDEVTVIERHESRPRDDYVWYDSEGMRVKVREISR